MGHATFRVGDLMAVIGDNAAHGDHRAGYNGLWSLTHRAEPTNLFVPAVAGLNFEHIFDGAQFDRDGTRTIFFEPRNAPMRFREISDSAAELHQPPTPTFRVESWTRFDLRPPHYVDMTFRFRATQHVFAHGTIGLFWASYMNAPDDKSIYFRHGNLWHQLCSARHNHASTVRHTRDETELRFVDGFPECLMRNFSPLRYGEPHYHGRVREMTALFLFDRVEGIRFTHSPSGGGVNQARQTTNPAWDFQYILPRYEVNRDYTFRVRLVYRPACSREEILRELAAWRPERE